MGESKLLSCPEMGRLRVTGCDADIGWSGKSIAGVCELGCDEAVSCREGRGLDKGVVGYMVSVLAGVEVVGVSWEKGRVTYRVEEL